MEHLFLPPRPLNRRAPFAGIWAVPANLRSACVRIRKSGSLTQLNEGVQSVGQMAPQPSMAASKGAPLA
eukprot:4134793-Pyramimonas_sp.AAC.1